MAKRMAERELNHDNWNDEDETEEAGTFKKAADSEIQKRVIRQAKRRLGAGSSDDKPKAFAGFGGFSLFKPNTTETPNFSFLAKPATDTASAGLPTVEAKKGDSTTEYLASIKQLNESVVSWIKEHVEKNPYCILSPIFKDYETHLKSIEEKKGSGNQISEKTSEEQSKPSGFSFTKMETDKPAFSFSTAFSKAEEGKPTFSFGSNAAATETKSIGSTAKATTTAPVFSFQSTFGSASSPATTPFSFGLTSKSSETLKKDDGEGAEEEDEEPPKPEVKPVTEDDAFYSIRCKLFYKKDNNYQDKGVGTLFLKKASNGKTQLVIRADTSLGNILLNILLSDVPTQRVGKNNVMIVCIPNPPIDPKAPPGPTPLLIRVKTDQEADELLSKLNEAKK